MDYSRQTRVFPSSLTPVTRISDPPALVHGVRAQLRRASPAISPLSSKSTIPSPPFSDHPGTDTLSKSKSSKARDLGTNNRSNIQPEMSLYSSPRQPERLKLRPSIHHYSTHHYPKPPNTRSTLDEERNEIRVPTKSRLPEKNHPPPLPRSFVRHTNIFPLTPSHSSTSSSHRVSSDRLDRPR